MTGKNTPRENYLRAKARLTAEQIDVFHALIRDYKEASISETGHAFGHFNILATLVLEGWRPLEAMAKAPWTPPFGVPLSLEEL